MMQLVTLLQLEKTMQLVIDDCGAAGTWKNDEAVDGEKDAAG